MKETTKKKSSRIVTAFYFFINGTIFAGWLPHIPYVQEKLNIGDGALGLILLNASLGAIIALPLAGWLAARFNGRIVSIVGSLIFCGISPFLVSAPDVMTLSVCLIIFGASCGAMDIGMNTLAVAVEKQYKRPIMSSFHALFSIGGFSGAALAGAFLFMKFAPQVHMITMAVLIGLFLLISIPFIYGVKEEKSRTGTKFSFPRGPVIFMGLIALFCMLSEGAIADWSSVYMKKNIKTSPELAAMAYSAYSIIMALGRFIGDRLVKRFNNVSIVRGSAFIAGAGMLTALLFQTPLTAIAGFGLVGLGLSNIVPIVFSSSGNIPGMSSAGALSAIATCGYFGFLTGPPVIGFIAEASSLRIALGIIVVLNILIIFFAGSIKLPREVRE